MMQWQRSLARVLAVVLALGFFPFARVGTVAAATATNFTPATVSSLPATVTITTSGVAANTTTAGMTLVFPSTLSISNLACTGIFQNASPVLGPVLAGPNPGTSQQSLGCAFTGGATVSGTSGNVMSFQVSGSGSGTVSLLTTGPNASQFVHADLTTEGLGTPGTLGVGGPAAGDQPAAGD